MKCCPMRLQDSLMINIFGRNKSIFLQRDKEKGKETFETNTINCAWSGIPSQAQTCQDLPRGF